MCWLCGTAVTVCRQLLSEAGCSDVTAHELGIDFEWLNGVDLVLLGLKEVLHIAPSAAIKHRGLLSVCSSVCSTCADLAAVCIFRS